MDVLNYIWLNNKEYYDPDKFRSKSPVPAEYLNNAFRMAEENSDVETNIWLDFDALSRKDKKFLEGLTAPQNLSFKNLSEIDAYKQDAFFRDPIASIWQKCDLIRLIVLDHVLSDWNTDTAYYSDFDALPPKISSNGIQEKLRRTGCVFCYCRGNFIENGFLGVSKAHKDNKNVLREKFIPYTKKSYSITSNGWSAFCERASEICGNVDSILFKREKLETFAFQIHTLWGFGTQDGQVLFDPNCLVIGASKPASPKTQSIPASSARP